MPTGASEAERIEQAAEFRTSIVVPCLNGARYIERSLRELCEFLEGHRGLLAPWQILLVDDGSTDGTAEIAERVGADVRVLRHASNRGKGAAVRTGVLAATGEFVFFIDADLPYELDALTRMLDYLDRKEFDLCLGTRTREPSAHRVDRSIVRRIASEVYTAFVSRIVVTGVRDTQCGFKGMRRVAAHYLFEQSRVDDFAFDVEIVYLAFKNDLDMKKIPVRAVRDEDSRVSLLRDAPRMLFSILKLPFRYHLGRYALLEDWRRRTSETGP